MKTKPTQEMQVTNPQPMGLQESHGILPSGFIRERMNAIKSLMKTEMVKGDIKGTKPGADYGPIPGCGTALALLKPGAEKLCVMFQLRPEFDQEVIELVAQGLPFGHREYRVKCRLVNMGGVALGEAFGVATTMETKYRFRTDWIRGKDGKNKEVPKEYWDTRDKILLGGDSFSTRKADGKHVIVQQVEHGNPADYWNTCSAIATKRAFVAAVRQATGASAIFQEEPPGPVQHGSEHDQDDPGYTPTTEEQELADKGLAPAGKKAQAKPSADQADGGQITDPRAIVVHFGKNKGKSLGELSDASVLWYSENKPKPEHMTTENIRLWKAAKMIMSEGQQQEEPPAQSDAPDELPLK